MQIACSHCGAKYVFDAALIPAEGYDARCTSCQAVFFVVREGPEPQSSGEPAAGVPAAAEAEPDTDAAPAFAPESLHRGTMEMAPMPPLKSDRAELQRPKIDMDLDLGPRFTTGNQAAGLRGNRRHTSESEPLVLRRPWARRGLFLGVALIAVIGSGVVVGVVCSKRLHAPPSVQPPIHIVRAPDPIAAEAFGRGLKALFWDTSIGYVAAAKAFDAACARDPEFTDAWAGAALAALLYAADLESQAEQASQEILATAQQALIEVAQAAKHGSFAPDDADAQQAGEDKLGSSALDGAQAARLLRVHSVQNMALKQSHQQAMALHQQAHALQRRGASLLLHGDHLTTQTPLMSAALAMWYAIDPSSQALAAQELKAFEQLSGGENMPVNPADVADPRAQDGPGALRLKSSIAQVPYGPLALWTVARLKAQDKKQKPSAVVAAYEAALTQQPQLRRARWELAMYQLSIGQADVARPLLEDLAHSDAPHDKALAQLAILAAQSSRPGRG